MQSILPMANINIPLLLLGLGWIVFYALHSLLASPILKGRVATHLPQLMPWYRLLYNLISGLFFVGLLWAQRQLSISNAWEPTAWQRILAAVCAFAGTIVLWAASRSYDMRLFVGLRQVTLRQQTADLDTSEPLVLTGMNRYLRHPLYAGIILLLLGWLLWQPNALSLMVVLITCGYLIVGIRLEERQLRKRYGDAYVQYQQEVPMLWPSLRKKRE